METMTQYPLRDVPLDVWQAARTRAFEEGLSIRAVIIGLISGYAQGRIKVKLDPKDRRKSRGPRPDGVTA